MQLNIMPGMSTRAEKLSGTRRNQEAIEIRRGRGGFDSGTTTIYLTLFANSLEGEFQLGCGQQGGVQARTRSRSLQPAKLRIFYSRDSERGGGSMIQGRKQARKQTKFT